MAQQKPSRKRRKPPKIYRRAPREDVRRLVAQVDEGSVPLQTRRGRPLAGQVTLVAEIQKRWGVSRRTAMRAVRMARLAVAAEVRRKQAKNITRSDYTGQLGAAFALDAQRRAAGEPRLADNCANNCANPEVGGTTSGVAAGQPASYTLPGGQLSTPQSAGVRGLDALGLRDVTAPPAPAATAKPPPPAATSAAPSASDRLVLDALQESAELAQDMTALPESVRQAVTHLLAAIRTPRASP